MRNIVRGALPVIAVLGATALVPASAQAVNCHTFGCVNRTLNKLQKQVKTDTRDLNVLLGCIQEAPVTQNGNGTAHTYGYWYQPNGGGSAYWTTALDGTRPGGSVSAWLLLDGCNPSHTASIARATQHALRSSARTIDWLSPFSPIAPEVAFTPASQ